MHLLAPYGSMKFLPLSTKVGGTKPDAPLAPYGDLGFLPLSTKVGSGGKDDPGPVEKFLAPYGSMTYLPLSTKVGLQKPGDDPVPI